MKNRGNVFDIQIMSIHYQIKALQKALGKKFSLNQNQIFFLKEIEELGLKYFIYPISRLDKVSKSSNSFFEALLEEQGNDLNILIVPFDIFPLNKEDDLRTLKKKIEIKIPKTYFVLGETENKFFSLFLERKIKGIYLLAGINPAIAR